MPLRVIKDLLLPLWCALCISLGAQDAAAEQAERPSSQDGEQSSEQDQVGEQQQSPGQGRDGEQLGAGNVESQPQVARRVEGQGDARQDSPDEGQPEGAEPPVDSGVPATHEDDSPIASDAGPSVGAPPAPCPSAPPCDCEGSDAAPRRQYVLESIEIRGNRRTREAVILREIQFEEGQVIDLEAEAEAVQASRYRLLATGFFSDVELSLRRGTERGSVILIVEVEERWTFIVHELALGVTEITPFGGLNFGEMNFLGLGISLSGAFVASAEQQAYRIRLADPRFLDSPISLMGEFLYNDARDFLGLRPVRVEGLEGLQRYAPLDYRRVGGSFGIGFRIGPRLNAYLDYRLEVVRAHVPAAAAQMGEALGSGIPEPIDFHLMPGRSILSAFVVTLENDTRDHPYLPSRGRFIRAGATMASDVIGSSYHYVKLSLDLDFYFALPWRHTFHIGFFTGSIFGNAPLYEMYFVGDLSDQIPARVLDLNFSHAPAPNVFRNSVAEMRYESLAARLDLEYIVPLYRGRRGVYGLDFFLLFGLYSIGSAEDFVSPPAGYGGGPFPFDLTVDLGFRFDTTAGVFGFAFQNLLGLIPFSEE